MIICHTKLCWKKEKISTRHFHAQIKRLNLDTCGIWSVASVIITSEQWEGTLSDFCCCPVQVKISSSQKHNRTLKLVCVCVCVCNGRTVTFRFFCSIVTWHAVIIFKLANLKYSLYKYWVFCSCSHVTVHVPKKKKTSLIYFVHVFLFNSFKTPQNGTLGSCRRTVFARLKEIVVNKLLGIIQ